MKQKNIKQLEQADTGCYLLLQILFSDAQRYAMAYSISISKGLGKTFSAQHYAEHNKNAFYISCKKDHTVSSLLADILSALREIQIGNISRKLDRIVLSLEDKEEPLLIIDSAENLKPKALHAAISLYKKLTNHCGIIFLGNATFHTTVVDGARCNNAQYSEVYDTIGRRFVTLSQLGPRDVELICRANGIHSESIISTIKDATKGDLHNISALLAKYSVSKTVTA